MIVCVVARDVDGEVVYDEFAEEYSLRYECRGNACRVSLVPIQCKYRVIENALELQISLYATVMDMERVCEQVTADLRLQSDCPYPPRKVTTLLYYADVGESVWDIGRNCHASPACIREENALEEEFLTEQRVLVVPIVN